MRISDWSSDVCSSDLFFRAAPLAAANHALPGAHVARDAVAIQRNLAEMNRSAVSIATHANRVATFVAACASVVRGTGKPQRRFAAGLRRPGRGACAERRSEGHTSELQSLMRISYAVFCLKKKKNKTEQQRR